MAASPRGHLSMGNQHRVGSQNTHSALFKDGVPARVGNLLPPRGFDWPLCVLAQFDTIRLCAHQGRDYHAHEDNFALPIHQKQRHSVLPLIFTKHVV